MNAAKYATAERLRNGAALQVAPKCSLLSGRFSSETLYRRFFAPKRSLRRARD